MNEIRVTFGELSAAQQNVTATATRIRGQLDDLQRRLAPLTAGWTGAAAEQYQARQREIDAAWADLAQVLGAIGGRLGQAEQTYRAVEHRNAARY
ncbi:WXG100 family type VII secretion target [Actinomycetospora sp. OC33-EN08]|uniref:ESAT-6-like protein n=1 Tax=Actinomycetospora aurantiaca TaxID=3129233 RepID=A0ABU8MNR6_9PSEU